VKFFEKLIKNVSWMFLLSIFLLIIIPRVLSTLPFEPQTNPDDVGLEVVYPQVLHFPIETNFTIPTQCFNLTQSPCMNGTNCSMDIINELGENIIHRNFTYNSYGYFEIDFDNANFTEPGHYAFLIGCDAGVDKGWASSNIELRDGAGGITTEQEAIIYIGLLFIIAILFIVTLVGAVMMDTHGEASLMELKINWKPYLKIFLFFMAYELLTFLISMSYVLAYNFLMFNFLSNILWVIMMVLLIANIPLIVMGGIIMFVKLLDENRKIIEKARGLEPR